jgi:hypothetical protein
MISLQVKCVGKAGRDRKGVKLKMKAIDFKRKKRLKSSRLKL